MRDIHNLSKEGNRAVSVSCKLDKVSSGDNLTWKLVSQQVMTAPNTAPRGAKVNYAQF